MNGDWQMGKRYHYNCKSYNYFKGGQGVLCVGLSYSIPKILNSIVFFLVGPRPFYHTGPTKL